MSVCPLHVSEKEAYTDYILLPLHFFNPLLSDAADAAFVVGLHSSGDRFR